MFGRISAFIDSLTKTKKNLLLGGFLIGALALTVAVSQDPTNYKQRASEIVSPPTTTGNISLVLSAPTTQLQVNQPVNVDVYLEAGDQKVTGLSFALSSINVGIGQSIPQSSPVEFSSVAPDKSVFNNFLKGINFFPNYYEYAAVDTLGKVATGKVKLGTVTALPKRSGIADIRFSNVQATALGQVGLLGNQQNVNIQFTVGTTTTPTIAPPTASPTPGITGSCKTLYDKIIAAYDNANACGGKYDAAADLNKDKFVNNQDYLLFLQNTNSGTNQVACTNYLNNTTNPCVAIPTPTGNVGIGKTVPTITITIAPPTATPSGPVPGDATGDKIVDIRDYQIWRDEYIGLVTTKRADFNKDGRVDLIDFSIFRNAFNPDSATPTPIASAKRVFMTSTFYSGNLGGLTGADAKCQARANAASLGGTWKAWLSTSTTSAASRLTHHNGSYKLVNGTVVANNWEDLIDGTLQNAIKVTEINTTASFSNCVWTNTSINGSTLPTNANVTACNNYTTSSQHFSRCGLNGATDSNWTDWTSSDSCSQVHPLYCFEQ